MAPSTRRESGGTYQSAKLKHVEKYVSHTCKKAGHTDVEANIYRPASIFRSLDIKHFCLYKSSHDLFYIAYVLSHPLEDVALLV